MFEVFFMVKVSVNVTYQDFPNDVSYVGLSETCIISTCLSV